VASQVERGVPSIDRISVLTLGTEFGPTNVALHAVGIAVGLGDAGEVLRRAAAIDTSELSIERRVRFLLDVAHAYAQRPRRRTRCARWRRPRL
jgi:hypothetical protein